MVTALFVLRLVHTLSAAALIGAIVFNWFIVRPALRLVPTAPGVVIAQRVGIGFTWLGWISLGLLGLTGTLRLALDGRLWAILSPAFLDAGAGRFILLMITAWAVTVAASGWMTLRLQPVLLSRLRVNPSPSLEAVDKRRDAQMRASGRLETLQIVNFIAALVAIFSGTAAAFGSLF